MAEYAFQVIKEDGKLRLVENDAPTAPVPEGVYTVTGTQDETTTSISVSMVKLGEFVTSLEASSYTRHPANQETTKKESR